ncbi:SusC/RagA family TonB-linked outer membrane protein [Flavobacterium degerlachei]|jgi:TonB-linked SusC/RagA family outer membrane protein|uniref:TonB-linked outer membrane protein, SusC/RagA family n=1 Tax=Flavobacterium degerlachei TaxID=229203 RepID=A0A1H2VD95_9FLAO|nr:TonB-dependent receptor [Flavobacterium degerlachei]SDW66308.1 TonB-linked outer membrane protein, SusC/RagA family [Flavobacterium degerlachei]
MRPKFNQILMLVLALITQITFAQNRTVSGTVSDNEGQALTGVNVKVKGTSNGVQTNFDGKYSISAKTGDVLVLSFIGLDTKTITVDNSNTLNVRMQSTAVAIDEVVIIAYGKAKKASYTGSATTIKSQDIENRAVTNVLSGIEGAVSGVQIQSGSGQPGSQPSVRIRGFSSISGSNTPLYVVDGVPFTGDINNINAADVASMTILKDAASTSLYGSKAANGVVMITTKKGTSSKDKFNFNMSTGLSTRSIPEYDRVDAFQYYPLTWEAIRNSRPMSTPALLATANAFASTRTPIDLVINPFNVPNASLFDANGQLNPAAQLLYPDDLDWGKQLERAGLRRNIDFSYQGKTERSDYFVSIGNLSEEASIQNSDFKRTTARLNVNTKLKEWFKTGANVATTFTDSNQAVDGVANTSSFNNPFRTIRYMGPIYPVLSHDATTGAVILDATGNPVYSALRGSGASNGRNVVYETLNNENKDKSLSFNGRTYLEVKFLKDLKFTTNFAFDNAHFNNNVFWNKLIGDGAPDGYASRTNTVTTGITFNQLLDYTKSVNNHNFNALVGHESFDYEYNYMFGSKRGQGVPNNNEFINYLTVSDLNSYTRNYATESYFSRVGYDYDEKYILSASVRRDGSSKFADANKWGNFWSVGAAWNLTRESFIEKQTWINELKLRASFGEVGNDSHTSYDGLNYYIGAPTFSLGLNNASEVGILTNDQGAPNLKWEKNTQKDIAIDYAFFGNRLRGSVEYYNRKTDGLIFNVPIPVSSGLDSKVENIGSMFNQGIEVSLDAMIVKTKEFSWNVNINASTIKNEITSLPQKEIINGTKKYAVGSSIYDYWLRTWYGVDPTDGYALYVVDPLLTTPTDTDSRTVNGVNVTINQNKALYEYHGTSLPDLFGSFTNTFKVGGFQMDVLMTYQLGGKIYDSNYAALMHSGNNYGSALHTDILDRWQKPGDITDVPVMNISRNTQNSAASNRWLVDSDYLSLRQVSLSYNLPKDLISKLQIDGAKFYVNGENLKLFAKRDGMDPQATFNGTTQNRFSPSRTISLGINLNF